MTTNRHITLGLIFALLAIIGATILFASGLAKAQDLTDKPLGTFEKASGAEVDFVLSPHTVAVAKRDAFDRIYLTTDTVTTRALRVFYVTDDSTITSKTVTVERITRTKTNKSFMRMKDGHFVNPVNGKIYKTVAKPTN